MIPKIFKGYPQFKDAKHFKKIIKRINYKKNKFIKDKAKEYKTNPLNLYIYLLQVNDYNKCSIDNFQIFLEKEQPSVKDYKIPDIFKTQIFERGFIISFYKNINIKNHIYETLRKNKIFLNELAKEYDLNPIYLLQYIRNKEIKNKTTEEFITNVREYSKEIEEQKKRKIERLKLLKEAATITNLEDFYQRPKRTIIAYLGPTNSGKTYKAIQKFKKSKNAIYLAPLRLLAREIYDNNIKLF